MANTWRTIADSEVDPESPVTTSLAQAWRDNPEGIAGGASGAPRIQTEAYDTGSVDQAAVAASAIGQGELKSTNGTVSLSSSVGQQTARKTLPGGHYGFYPRTSYSSTDSNGSAEAQISFFSSNTNIGEDTFIFLTADTPNNASVSITARQTYVQASPPYDMGDGECGLFIELELDTNGRVIGTYVAPDPVWANNGPTSIRPDYIDKATGKAYKRIRRPAVTREDVLAGRADMADRVTALKEAPVEDVEITMAYKNADMHLFPHSWVSPPQGTICLLDPVNTFDLLMLHEAGEDVSELMHKGYIQIGDEVKRKGPPGVVPVAFKWRNSR